jgi:hypothetical protein
MATEDRRDRRRIDDYTGVTTTVTIPAGQYRWYDNVTGHDADKVIELVGDGTRTIAQLVDRLSRVVRVDTTSADVAASLPSDPEDGQTLLYVNTGTGGNHITGLPGSVNLGDGFSFRITYDKDNTTWRYEDVIIDKYTNAEVHGTQTVYKWSGGRMALEQYITTPGTNPMNVTYLEAFVGTTVVTVSNDLINGCETTYQSPTTTGVNIYQFSSSGGSITPHFCSLVVNGRWKA